ncbi:hypothetical protein FHA61_19725 [Escherichia coli]|nr:hypothetical protein [Escherichia coli]
MAHQLLIGKGMITLNLKRIFLALTLLPLFAVAADDCALSDPTPLTRRRVCRCSVSVVAHYRELFRPDKRKFKIIF